MAKEGPYEIVPAEEIHGLKEEVKRIKSRYEKFGTPEFVDSFSELTKNMSDMMDVFKLAAQQIKTDESGPSRKLGDKLDKIIEQNQTIAEALVSMNEMITTDVDKLLNRIEESEKHVMSVPVRRPAHIFHEEHKHKPRVEHRVPKPVAPRPAPRPMPVHAPQMPPPPPMPRVPHEPAPQPMPAHAPPHMPRPHPMNIPPPMPGPQAPGPMPPPHYAMPPPPMPRPQGPGPMPPGPGAPPPGPSAPNVDMSDLDNIPEMPPLEIEEPKKEGFFNKIFKKK
ncbi:hypothetical protein ACFLZX_03160 [Nanoarchaeota archaeon]